jgi:CRP-like cAMP-binding protein
MPETEGRPLIPNRLLAALSESDYQRLAPQLEPVSLARGQILFEPGEPMREIYFPTGAAIALVSILENGATTEIGLIGQEGLVGLPVFLGGNSTISRAVVQIAGSALKLDAEVFKGECARGGTLHQLLLLYTQARLTQVSQTAACCSHHGVEKQLSRWLLSVRDCIEKDELQLTQKVIAEMLGVRRASITEVAISLQEAGIIRYTRGRIAILDQPALEAKACECYSIVKQEFARLLRPPEENQHNAENY